MREPDSAFGVALVVAIPGVRRVAFRLARGDRALAEDLTQGALLKAWELETGVRPAKLGPWLKQVVRNAFVDALRERQRREAAPEALAGLQAPEPAPEAAALARIDLKALLARLPEWLSDPLLGRALGFTDAELGVRLRVHPTTARLRVRHAREIVLAKTA